MHILFFFIRQTAGFPIAGQTIFMNRLHAFPP